MKIMPLTQGKFALVDDDDYVWLSKHNWFAVLIRGNWYACRNSSDAKPRRVVRMHISILGKQEGKEIDHRDRDGLNNQKSNLRFCTHAENMRNGRLRRNNTSGYKGVSWHKKIKKWTARIKIEEEGVNLGVFTCLIKAAEAYDKKAKELHGDFACLNFPELSRNQNKGLENEL